VILLVNYQKTSKASFDIKRNYTSKDALIQVCLYLGLYFGLSALKSRGKNDKKIERIYNVGKRVNKMEDLEKENKVPETHKKGSSPTPFLPLYASRTQLTSTLPSTSAPSIQTKSAKYLVCFF
jgi:hypothetical protein